MRKHAAVQIDHPAVARIVEEQIVGVEVGVVEAGAVEARDQAAGRFPGRGVARGVGAVAEGMHVFDAFEQDRAR
jgi:hypothetical protein